MKIPKKLENYLEVASGSYKESIFESLLHFQILESLLRDCILKSYGILDKTSANEVAFTTTKKMRDDLAKKGLGYLAEEFKRLSPEKELCDKIKKLSKIRNDLAHKAVAEHLKMKFSQAGAREFHEKSDAYKKAADDAGKAYFDLLKVYEKLLEVHGEHC